MEAIIEPWEEEMRRDIKRREIQARAPKAGPPHDRRCAGCERCFRRPTAIVGTMKRFRGKLIGPISLEVAAEAVEIPFTDLTQEQRYRIRQIAEENNDE